MTNNGYEELLKKIGREDGITEYLKETTLWMKKGWITVEEANMRLNVVLEMEEVWKKEPEENTSPFDSAADAEGDYQ